MKAFLVLKMAGTINANGKEVKLGNDHIVGISPVFDDYDFALGFAKGDADLVLPVDIEEKP
jgi:hypothetical protein